MILEEMLTCLKNGNDDIAYTVKNNKYSYRTFYKYVCNIYNFLLLSNKQKVPIIVYGNKDVYMKATFLACSFAGIAYIPIDESIPTERVEKIIEQTKPWCIIGNFKSTTVKNISLSDIYEIMNNESFTEIDKIYLKENDIYYIIYTSGSTGNPKGVKVSYKNLDSCINWVKTILKPEKEIFLNQANFSFDLSVADLYTSLITGSEHFILENTSRFDFKNIFSQLQESRATIAVFTPTFVEVLMMDKKFNEELLPNLKTILFCGEKLLKSTVEKLFLRFPKIKIINSYGPTECTFAVTSVEITRELLIEDELPIGVTKSNVEIIILNNEKLETKDGEAGEILIIGDSVAIGYVTEEKEKHFIKYKGKTAYLTGDVGYFKNGVLYYKGRKDSQIKYMGHRIELNDIENNFLDLKLFEYVKVIEKRDCNDNVIKLVAFVKLKSEINIDSEQIRQEVLKKLPIYMCPKIIILNEFPVNSNGKIDVIELRRKVDGK